MCTEPFACEPPGCQEQAIFSQSRTGETSKKQGHLPHGSRTLQHNAPTCARHTGLQCSILAGVKQISTGLQSQSSVAVRIHETAAGVRGVGCSLPHNHFWRRAPPTDKPGWIPVLLLHPGHSGGSCAPPGLHAPMHAGLRALNQAHMGEGEGRCGGQGTRRRTTHTLQRAYR